MSDIASGWAALVGALVGGSAAIAAQLVAQWQIGRREREERRRNEARVRSLFATHIGALRVILKWQVEDATVWDLDEYDRRLVPLNALLDQFSLVLLLEPKAIEAIAGAVRILDVALRFARQERERGNREYESASPGVGKANALDREREHMKAIFANSNKAFASALRALGKNPDEAEFSPKA